MKISNLAPATAINAEDVFPIVQGGKTKKVSAETIFGDVDSALVGIPTYWQTVLKNGANEIRQAMETAGRNKSAFLFYSDAHWDDGSQMSPVLLKYLHKNTAMTKTFFGGDIVSNESTERNVMEYLYEWRGKLKGLSNHHSVVGNHDDGNTTNNLFSENYVYAYLLASEEVPNMVLGDGMYYYIDEPCEKTRYLFIDTAYEGLSDVQTTFIKNTLISTPENWHIVVVSHIWYMPDYSQYNVRPIPITGLSDSASVLCEILDNYNSRSGEFADCKAKVEFCIGGHVHYDYVGVTSGGIPIILCETASLNVRGNFTYTLNTTTETAVSGIIADYNNNNLSVVRVGRGNSFVVDLNNPTMENRYSIITNLTNVSSSSAVSQVADGEAFSTTLTVTLGEMSSVIVTMGGTDITSSVYNAESGVISIAEVTGNVVITAIAVSNEPLYTNVLDTVGYKDGYRLSGNSGDEIINEGTDITNYISCSSGVTIYMENVIAPYTDDYDHYHYITCYDENKTHIGGYSILLCEGIEYDGDGNITSFITPIGTDYTSTAYIRIGVQDINENSIITVNEAIE